MENIELLKAIYEEKQNKYLSLCDAYVQASDAASAIKAMCDIAQDEMMKAGEKVIEAMSE